MRATMDKTTELQRFDPWAGTEPARKYLPDDPETAPMGWHSLSATTREIVGWILTEPEQTSVALGGLALGPWRRLRARFLSAADMGESAALQSAVSQYYIDDLKERQRWRVAADELCDARYPSHAILNDGGRKMKAMGDVLTTLRARRKAIDEQITRLETARRDL